jgi:hypothetical protein
MSFEQTDFWIERWRQAAKDLEAVDKCLMDLEKLLNEASTPDKTDTNNPKT